MSGIFGIFHQDKKPVRRSHLQGLAKSIKHRGPDGVNILNFSHMGLGHAMLHTTPESANENLPFTDKESSLTITADARIDNREELSERIGFKNIDGLGDSLLILEAFKKLGTSSFQLLNGDFSFVIWNPRQQQLICVRDYIGIKPFYYHHTPRRFVFSSEIKQLAEYPDITLQANETLIAEYLSFSFCSKTETLFTDISRLAPAHYLVVQANTIKSYKYWSWEPKKTLHYKITAEYTEHFIDTFGDAVKNRLRSSSAVSAELSGGLDSSTVVGMANKLLLQDGSKRLNVYSMVFPGLKCDEKSYIEAVREFNQLHVNYIPYDNYLFRDWVQQTLETKEPPDYPNLTMNNPLLATIHKSGSRIILSGIGGDEWFTGSGYPYLDYLQDGEFTALFRELRYQMRKGVMPTAKRCLVNLFWPLIPSVARRKIAERSAKRHIAPWLSESFTNRTRLVERISQTDSRPSLKNLGNTALANVFTQAGVQFFLEQLDRQRALWNVENRYPFFDKKIVEFAFAIPDYQRLRQGQIKQILKDPRNFLLPEAIKKRDTKAEFSFLFNVAFQESLFLHSFGPQPLNTTDRIRTAVLEDTVRVREESIKQNKYLSGHKTWELWFSFSMNIWYNNLINNFNIEEKNEDR